MRFNQPTDYSPGTGNTALLPCQLSSCHPPSQHMGCVRSKKAAEQLRAAFLPPCPLQLSQVSGTTGSSRSCLPAVQRIQGQAGTQEGNDSPSLLPGLSISALFKRLSWAQEDTLYRVQPKNKILQNVYAAQGGMCSQITSDLTPSACPFPPSALLPVLLNCVKLFFYTFFSFVAIFTKAESLNILCIFQGSTSCTDGLFLWNYWIYLGTNSCHFSVVCLRFLLEPLSTRCTMHQVWA